ncbi:MAG: lysophospholipid acyltransferase family protein [Planctomycetes bacterium]|nr:lysophospholipid acyltransferase family protein [Planctomycetota bacterium]
MTRRSRRRLARRVLRRLALAAVRPFGAGALRILVGSCRARVHGWNEHVETEHARGRAVLFALWHNRLLVPVWLFRGLGVHVLVSRHEDGEMITRILERVGFRAVRGSAERSPPKHSKGGIRGLLAMARAGRQGHDLAFTLDGPRGPIYSIAPGVFTLARRAGTPVVPVGIEIARGWRLRSWDRFRVPKPFSRAVCVFGPPLVLPEDEPAARAQLIEAMIRVSREASAELGVEDPFADAGGAPVGG